MRCRGCELGDLGLPQNLGAGPPDAEVAVVGINPSVQTTDAERGAFLLGRLATRPEVWARRHSLRIRGAARAMVALAEFSGLDVCRTYSTNLVKCATPSNRAPTREEVDACLGTHLRAELEGLPELRAVLAFGACVGRALLGSSDFGATGTLEGTTAEVLVLRHPIYTLRRWTKRSSEGTKIRTFLRRWAPSSVRTGAFTRRVPR
ncbi:MAG: uracil-DNA glycosylase family protein [Planctomycetota bacterium]